MQPLLQITTTPAIYELTVHNAKLEYEQEHVPTADVRSSNGEFIIETQSQKLKLSTYEARRSLGFAKVGDRLRDAAQKGQDNVVNFIKEANAMGRSLSRIDQGVTIGSLMQQKFAQQSSSVTVFIPSAGADISWEPGDIKIDYKKGSLDYEFKKNPYQLHYIRGDVSCDVVQKPTIEIKYVGSPLYVPPSSDPEYVEE